MDELFAELLSHGPIGAAVVYLLLAVRNHTNRLKAMSDACNGRHDRQLIEDGKLKTESATQAQSLANFGESMKRVTRILDDIEERLRNNENAVGKVETALEAK